MDINQFRSKIIGTGSAVPPRRVTNEDLAQVVDTSDEWITSRTGIQSRHLAAVDMATSDLACQAALPALEMAAVAPAELDLILVATSTPDYLNFPSTACLVQDKLAARKAAAFDLSAACSGFAYALSVADQFIRSGMYQKILVIGADILSKYLDWQDRNTCVLFGDGAGAVVLERTATEAGIVTSYLGADGRGANLLLNPVGGSRRPMAAAEGQLPHITMDGRAVFKFSTKVIVEGVTKALEQAGLGLEDIDLLIPHQANTRIIEYARDKLGLSSQKVYVNIHKYGNTSAATIPIALDEANRAGRIGAGDTVVTIGFGGGLTWASNVIIW